MDQLEKSACYQQATSEILSIVDGIDNTIARMATVNCVLSQTFPYYYWTGFYLVDPKDDQALIVGPYQGTLGCLQIPFGKGVCGTAAQLGQTQIVRDVHAIANHIACDALSQSEIVVPVRNTSGQLIAVFDVDSIEIGSFDETDQKYLESLMHALFEKGSE